MRVYESPLYSAAVPEEFPWETVEQSDLRIVGVLISKDAKTTITFDRKVEGFRDSLAYLAGVAIVKDVKA